MSEQEPITHELIIALAARTPEEDVDDFEWFDPDEEEGD